MDFYLGCDKRQTSENMKILQFLRQHTTHYKNEQKKSIHQFFYGYNLKTKKKKYKMHVTDLY